MKKKKLSKFSMSVISLIKKVPKGKVTTYGQIASMAGKPNGARAVTWILHSCSKAYKLPWHRVVNSKGEISFPWSTLDFLRQKSLLEKEGIEFSDGGKIDLKKFQWRRPTRPDLIR